MRILFVLMLFSTMFCIGCQSRKIKIATNPGYVEESLDIFGTIMTEPKPVYGPAGYLDFGYAEMRTDDCRWYHIPLYLSDDWRVGGRYLFHFTPVPIQMLRNAEFQFMGIVHKPQ